VRITSVKEIELPIPGAGLVPEATPERLAQHPWLAPRFVTPDGKLRLLIQALVVESQGRRIVVDTCVGNRSASTTLRHGFVEFSVQRLASGAPFRAVGAC